MVIALATPGMIPTVGANLAVRTQHEQVRPILFPISPGANVAARCGLMVELLRPVFKVDIAVAGIRCLDNEMVTAFAQIECRGIKFIIHSYSFCNNGAVPLNTEASNDISLCCLPKVVNHPFFPYTKRQMPNSRKTHPATICIMCPPPN